MPALCTLDLGPKAADKAIHTAFRVIVRRSRARREFASEGILLALSRHTRGPCCWAPAKSSYAQNRRNSISLEGLKWQLQDPKILGCIELRFKCCVGPRILEATDQYAFQKEENAILV